MAKTNYVDLVKKQNRELSSSREAEVVVYFKQDKPTVEDLKKFSLGLNFELKPGGTWISKPYFIATTMETDRSRLLLLKKHLLRVANVVGVDVFRDRGEQILANSGKWTDF